MRTRVRAPARPNPAAVGTANMVLQGVTVVSKAVLLLVLARWLSADDVGVFGLLAATLAFSMFLVGFDFHAYSSREMLSGSLAEAPRLFRDQAVFHAAFYAVALPALFLVFTFSILPYRLVPVFYFLLVAEHVGQEVQRLLITVSRSTAAAAMMFLRGGLWVWAVLATFYWYPDARSVGTAAWAWAAGSVGAIAFGLYRLRDLEWSPAWNAPIDWFWIRAGIRQAMPFLLATLSLRAAMTVDRYALKLAVGDAAVGVYTVYSAATIAIVGFVEAGVIFVLRPGVVAAFRHGDDAAYRARMRRLISASLKASLVLLAVAVAFARPVLSVLGESIYLSHLPALWVVLATAVLLVTVHLVDTALYVRANDRGIAAGAVTAVAVVTGLSLWLVPAYGVFGAATALAGGLMAAIIVKGAFLGRGR